MADRLSFILKMVLLFGIVSIILSGCVTPKPQPQPDAGTDIWTGELTGVIPGGFKLTAWPKGGNQDFQIVKGSMNLKMTSMGSGTADLNGTIKDGIIEAYISGLVDSYYFSGSIKGNISENRGTGTWIVDTPDGKYEGKWTARK